MSQASLINLEDLNKIKLITYPDRIHDSGSDVLLINLSIERLIDFQTTFMSHTNISCNIYLYEETSYQPREFDWLLNIFRSSSLTIIDLDNIAPHLKEFIAYFLSHPTTFWLTNTDKIQYNHISKNKIYDFDFLQTLGGNLEKQ
jgi:hypothetical protein